MDSPTYASSLESDVVISSDKSNGVSKFSNLVGDEKVQSHLTSGLEILLQAYRYALDLNRDLWQFAVSWTELRQTHMTTADCRWLMWHGWVEFARELRPHLDGTRQFQHNSYLAFRPHTSVVLTKEGVTMASHILSLRVKQQVEASSATTPTPPTPSRSIPQWDRDYHELRLFGRLVKQFKLPSRNQETILMAFEEEGWPPRIDDPLPPTQCIDAKQRLHDTIKSLNRNQKERLVRFIGDGTGEGVRWDFIRDGTISNPV